MEQVHVEYTLEEITVVTENVNDNISVNPEEFTEEITVVAEEIVENIIIYVNVVEEFAFETIEAYISNVTAIGLLEDELNWNVGGVYIGVAITGTYQGQKHYNNEYFFEAINDNIWIRLTRG